MAVPFFWASRGGSKESKWIVQDAIWEVTASVWDFAAAMGDVAGAMWDVSSSMCSFIAFMWNVQTLCGLL